MILFPPAKINLGLFVTGPRGDGFHNIKTLFYPLGYSDILEVIPIPGGDGSPGIQLKCSGILLDGKMEDNLVTKAYQLMAARFPLPSMDVYLFKHIPTGAGLGGGSSDGAMMLKAINELADCGLSLDELRGLALDLGSDCPFFLDPKPVIATGRGEIFEEISMKLEGYWLYLFNPGVGISTQEAYRNVKLTGGSPDLDQIMRMPDKEWKYQLNNGFEDFAISKVPEIGVIKEMLYSSGAIFASMSGSGSSVYGLFENEITIPDRIKPYYIWSEKLLE